LTCYPRLIQVNLIYCYLNIKKNIILKKNLYQTIFLLVIRFVFWPTKSIKSFQVNPRMVKFFFLLKETLAISKYFFYVQEKFDPTRNIVIEYFKKKISITSIYIELLDNWASLFYSIYFWLFCLDITIKSPIWHANPVRLIYSSCFWWVIVFSSFFFCWFIIFLFHVIEIVIKPCQDLSLNLFLEILTSA
jgi:hypothetical protein